jgi:hypothetical protein
MTHRQELTELQYSDERTGPFKLYLYNRNGFHSGAQWFQVRVTDGGDWLVFHANDEKILYPKAGNFWKEIGIVI